MARYFGTNGIRGTLSSVTPDFIAKMCASFATWAKRTRNYKNSGGDPLRVLVARDTRTTGEMVEGAVVSGLLWAGAQPVLLGIMPSPGVEFLGKKRRLPSIIITSSHNPPEWVALKFNDDRGVALTKERGEEIEQIYEEGLWDKTSWDKIPPVERDYNAINEYISVLRSGCIAQHSFEECEGIHNQDKSKPLEGLRVVIDCGNGTAGRVAPGLFKELGAKVITLNAQEDGFFPGRNSEPTEQNVQDLIKAVKAVGADVGIAYDGDGDRLALVDEKGNYVLGDKVFAIAVDIRYGELERKRAAMVGNDTKNLPGHGDIVTTVATSNIIREIAARHGANVKYVVVGAPYIAEEMEREGANYAMGGEEVGGIIWPDVHPGKDAILSSLKIALMLVQQKKKLSEVVDSLPKLFNVKEKIEAGPERFEKINRLQEKMRGLGNAIVIDGVRLDFDDGWCIARASGTENFIRVFGEAKSEKRAKELVDLMKKELDNIK
ncbi:MAG: phosphoglucosamine mutase [Candidatus Micrarchaeota archaeon]|nr:phosphoglucosamine mutase [Candidatus Micrarchaeota archaeon]